MFSILNTPKFSIWKRVQFTLLSLFHKTQPSTALNSKHFQQHEKSDLKVALQILGPKFYQNTKKSSLYSQSLLIFIHRTPAVESHPITRDIRDLLWPGRNQRETQSIFT